MIEYKHERSIPWENNKEDWVAVDTGMGYNNKHELQSRESEHISETHVS